MSDREQLRAERRRLEAEYRAVYEALDSHFMLYGDVDGAEPVGFYHPDDAGLALPDECDDDETCDFDDEVIT